MREIAVAKDLPEQSRSDRFSGVNGDGRHASVGVAQAVMASLYAHDGEAGLGERADELFAGESFPPGHQATCTCCTATNVRRGGRGPSARHSVMASVTRRISTSSDLACVWQPRSSGTEATKYPSSSCSTNTVKGSVRLAIQSFYPARQRNGMSGQTHRAMILDLRGKPIINVRQNKQLLASPAWSN
jgi:hypothetical protein